ncbi:uncharacterized protein BXZ73DRAFT_87072 [Epithele typhae]|uniref:uncharacterized protein n=1 Tax=Epithele typhae TaxID=378194 RepID=UPI002007A474|nr:uncharacterized protein BXZ73DRAFT_87072 [Epithele typhae]KAH9944113.1 hypothetical protein BXZ73DRAFT_87072 [Epithele typhae]
MSQPSPNSPLLPHAAGLLARSSLLWRTGAILGAFGTHGLQKRPGMTAQSCMHGRRPPIYNGLALLAVSMHPRFAIHRFAGPAIALGSAVFSGSIVALVLGGDRFKWMGPVTPMGGSVMIAGYIALVL